MSALLSLLNFGSGLATRATAARVGESRRIFITTSHHLRQPHHPHHLHQPRQPHHLHQTPSVDALCRKAPEELRRRRPGQKVLPARRLLSALTHLTGSERSPTVRRAFANSMANVARVAPASAVTGLVRTLCKRYRSGEGGIVTTSTGSPRQRRHQKE